MLNFLIPCFHLKTLIYSQLRDLDYALCFICPQMKVFTTI